MPTKCQGITCANQELLTASWGFPVAFPGFSGAQNTRFRKHGLRPGDSRHYTYLRSPLHSPPQASRLWPCPSPRCRLEPRPEVERRRRSWRWDLGHSGRRKSKRRRRTQCHARELQRDRAVVRAQARAGGHRVRVTDAVVCRSLR